MLPPLIKTGDLPAGIHPANWTDARVLARGRLRFLLHDFLDTWQMKRDGTRRGIVEVNP